MPQSPPAPQKSDTNGEINPATGLPWRNKAKRGWQCPDVRQGDPVEYSRSGSFAEGSTIVYVSRRIGNSVNLEMNGQWVANEVLHTDDPALEGSTMREKFGAWREAPFIKRLTRLEELVNQLVIDVEAMNQSRRGKQATQNP
jgi:hypothetical protein